MDRSPPRRSSPTAHPAMYGSFAGTCMTHQGRSVHDSPWQWLYDSSKSDWPFMTRQGLGWLCNAGLCGVCNAMLSGDCRRVRISAVARAHVMRLNMQGQQLCQQPRGWECLALSSDSESAEIAYVGGHGQILPVRTSTLNQPRHHWRPWE